MMKPTTHRTLRLIPREDSEELVNRYNRPTPKSIDHSEDEVFETLWQAEFISSPPRPPPSNEERSFRRHESETKRVSFPRPTVPPPRKLEQDLGPPREIWRSITPAVMSAMRSDPTDHEIAAAQSALDQAAELTVHKNNLLAMPSWVPISQPMLVISKEIKRFRQMAAMFLHCDPLDLED